MAGKKTIIRGHKQYSGRVPLGEEKWDSNGCNKQRNRMSNNLQMETSSKWSVRGESWDVGNRVVT